MKQLINARIFTGFDWIENGAVTCEDGRIAAIDTSSTGGSNQDTIDCGGNILAPALLDLQQYGAGGRLFSAYPEPASLKILAEENLANGVADCLVTIATQPREVILNCIEAIKQYWREGGTGILGMHLEGPFINQEKNGAHKQEWIIEASEAFVKELIARGKNVIRMVTLAPECCSPTVIKLFREAGILVSAGHSNASYEQAMQFPAKGISLVTHLFNAMSAFHHRDVGLAGAAFHHPLLQASIIPDGIHVSYAALKIAKNLMGERLFFITDSVTETAMGPYQHQLQDDRYSTQDGILSGSAITLLQGVRNAVNHCDIPIEESLRMASLYPAKILGLDKDFGAVAPGNKASMILLNEKLELIQCFAEA